jgi:hypothetical protein
MAPRDRARQTEEKATGDNVLHAQTAPPIFADGFSPANLAGGLRLCRLGSALATLPANNAKPNFFSG